MCFLQNKSRNLQDDELTLNGQTYHQEEKVQDETESFIQHKGKVFEDLDAYMESIIK